MRKFKRYLAACLCTVCILPCFSGVTKKESKNFPKGTPGISMKHGFANKNSFYFDARQMPKRSIVRTAQSPDEPSGTISNATTWGSVIGPDGSTWFYTQTFEPSPTNEWFYGASTITFYNDKNEEMGKINIDIPDNESVNDIVPFGTITNKFFDRDETSLEVTVYIHALVNYQANGRMEAHSINGEKKYTHQGDIMMYFDASERWDSYQRLAIGRTIEKDNGVLLSMDVIKPCGWSDTKPTVDYTFDIPYDNIMYCDGPFFYIYKVDGQPVYAITYYELPFVKGFNPETYDPIIQEDNNFLVNLYDRNYQLIKQVKVPVQTEPGAFFSQKEMGTLLGDGDLTKGLFTNDEKLNLIVANKNYILSSDSYLCTYEVYDEDGNKVNSLCSNVITHIPMRSIAGQEEQIAFLQQYNDAERFAMVNIPSCETAAILPNEINGDQLSTNIDRYPAGDSYQYVIGLGKGISDEEGNTIGRIGWYNPDCSLDHFVSFNLGKNCQLFSPIVSSEMLDPYLFNTDQKQEYVYSCKLSREGQTELEDILVIANEDGKVLRQFGYDEQKGKLSGGGMVDIDGANPRLFIMHYIYEEDKYTLDFYKVPFVRFAAGGEGTVESPYVISTPGDMNMIKNEPAAHYVLGNDIDMSLSPAKWQPVENFEGTLDGKGYSISNLIIDTDASNAALFGMTGTEAAITNLNLVRPQMKMNDNNWYASFLSASAMQTTFDNIHIYDATVEGESTASFGSIVCEATLNSTISSSSVNNLTIDTPNAQIVGGIVGETRTGASVSAVKVTGNIDAMSEIGGIAGRTGTDSKISNSYVDVNLTGSTDIGGIVGFSSRGLISNCYAMGTIKADGTLSEWSTNINVGGIAGGIESSWPAMNPDGTTTEDPDPAKVISGCVAAQSEISVTDGATAAHRIIGFTIADEQYYEGETPYEEKGLDANYALPSANISSVAPADGATNNPDGESVETSDLNKAFFEKIGFAWGDAAEKPWKEGAPMPVLYFEENAVVVTLDRYSVSVAENETVKIKATVYGAELNAVEFVSSDSEIATVDSKSTDTENNTVEATVSVIKIGNAEISVKIGEKTYAVCMIQGVASVKSIEDNAPEIHLEGNNVVAEGAANMTIFNMQGVRMASADSDRISVDTLAKGAYIAVATMNDGNHTATKIIVR